MRNNFFLFLALGVSFFCFSCGGSPAESEVIPVVQDTTERPFDSMVLKPRDTITNFHRQKNTKISPFSNLGCCLDEASRTADGCCCQLVLEKYEQILRENDLKTIKKFATDPILGDCKKKMRTRFDSVDQKFDDDEFEY